MIEPRETLLFYQFLWRCNMNNIHDKAHELASMIKGSDQYKEYMRVKEKVGQNAELTEMVNDFQGKQFELQKAQMSGQELGPEMMEQVQNLYGLLMKDPVAAEYIQAEVQFSLMVNDVYQILADAVKTDGQ